MSSSPPIAAAPASTAATVQQAQIELPPVNEASVFPNLWKASAKKIGQKFVHFKHRDEEVGLWIKIFKGEDGKYYAEKQGWQLDSTGYDSKETALEEAIEWFDWYYKNKKKTYTLVAIHEQ